MRAAPRGVIGLLEQAFTRAAGAPAHGGNRVRLLRDAAENYPAWLDAIARAQRTIHFETYIIHDDDIGRRFADALGACARAGVRVRVLYDWWGARGLFAGGLFRRLAAAGVDVRCFNPPNIIDPLAWLNRDHRKMITVDGEIAFVGGLCVGQAWVGDPRRGEDGWRDTGIAIEGPAVAAVERAFADAWAAAGTPLPSGEVPDPGDLERRGDAGVRVVATVPNVGGLYRLDQLIAAAARRSLWLADAYFVATTTYVRALLAAAQDGVDVRLLVPGVTDMPGLRAISRAGYRPLLEGGVRVYEWNGPMMHAKTAVADGRWARVGSSNLNPSSWMANWELDIAVDDAAFAQAMERMYEDDLAASTEVVLGPRRRLRPVRAVPVGRGRRRRSGRARRATAGAIAITSAVQAAVSNRRVLGPAEARVLVGSALLLLILAAVAVQWPAVISLPLAAASGAVAASLLTRAWQIHRGDRRRRRM